MLQPLKMPQRLFSTIILAAGKGTRMKSPLPKVLHPVAGDPMIRKVVLAAKLAGSYEIRVVVGSGEELVRRVVEPIGAQCFKQEEQKGTANAVQASQPETLKDIVIILSGDAPLVEAKDIQAMVEEFYQSSCDLIVVTSILKNPGSLGRIVRENNLLHSIVEVKDAGPETKKIREVNSGIYITRAEILAEYLPKIKNQNSQKEFYLTDIVSLLREDHKSVEAKSFPQRVSFGVNSQAELMKASQFVFRASAHKHMENGVVILDDRNTYIEPGVEIGEGSVIYPGSFIKSKTKIGRFCVIEPHCFLNESTIEDSVQIRQGSYLEKAVVKARSVVGPYARLRPETEIGEESKIGNFVELKKVKFGARSKASHLTYLGDAVVGEDTNIGCGTITCNYAADLKKYQTTIGNNVFVGSDVQFVAPVVIGDGAIIGAGSTITKDVSENSLAVARARQVAKENYRKKV